MDDFMMERVCIFPYFIYIFVFLIILIAFVIHANSLKKMNLKVIKHLHNVKCQIEI